MNFVATFIDLFTVSNFTLSVWETMIIISLFSICKIGNLFCTKYTMIFNNKRILSEKIKK